jgi:hypothetical protein
MQSLREKLPLHFAQAVFINGKSPPPAGSPAVKAKGSGTDASDGMSSPIGAAEASPSVADNCAGASSSTASQSPPAESAANNGEASSTAAKTGVASRSSAKIGEAGASSSTAAASPPADSDAKNGGGTTAASPAAAENDAGAGSSTASGGVSQCAKARSSVDRRSLATCDPRLKRLNPPGR